MEFESTNNWYVLSGENKLGPFDYKTIIHMLQKNELMDYSYVWAPHLTEWKQVYSLKEFSSDRFHILRTLPEYKEAFIDRKGPRKNVNIKVVGHNNAHFFDGKITSLSEKGALCLINHPLVHVGDQIKIQIKPDDPEESPFNVEGKIIRKNFTNERVNSKSGLYYVVSFVDLKPKGLDQIKTWLQQA